jgi:hypothetical protein
MPRIAKGVATRRLNLEMTENVRQKLEDLRGLTEADSLAEVVRRALLVYEYLWDEKRTGGTLIIKKDDKEKELVLL